MNGPQIKVIITTSDDSFSGTNDEVKIIFRKYICIPNVEMQEFPHVLNENGQDIDTGSTKTYTFNDVKLLNKSYVSRFTIEKKSTFYGTVIDGGYTPIPIGFSYSNDWRLKRVRVYYNNELVVDTNPTNREANSIWLDKNNYWFTYPDPNTEVVSPNGVCGDVIPNVIGSSKRRPIRIRIKQQNNDQTQGVL